MPSRRIPSHIYTTNGNNNMNIKDPYVPRGVEKDAMKLWAENNKAIIATIMGGGTLVTLGAMITGGWAVGAYYAASNGLYGAAAYTAGMAAVGGGSIASGGGGMLGGMYLISGLTASGIIGTSMIVLSLIKLFRKHKDDYIKYVNKVLEKKNNRNYNDVLYSHDDDKKIIYVGQFKNLEMDGKGTLFDDNEPIIHGIFLNGKCIKIEKK